jgi:hypothetical protein
MDYALCPQCELPAEVIDRFSLSSTDGSLAHVKIACLAGHVFTPLADDVTSLDPAAEAATPLRMGYRR